MMLFAGLFLLYCAGACLTVAIKLQVEGDYYYRPCVSGWTLLLWPLILPLCLIKAFVRALPAVRRVLSNGQTGKGDEHR